MADRLMELSAELKRLRVVDLREKLQTFALPTKGRKAELVTRLAQAMVDAEEAELQKKSVGGAPVEQEEVAEDDEEEEEEEEESGDVQRQAPVPAPAPAPAAKGAAAKPQPSQAAKAAQELHKANLVRQAAAAAASAARPSSQSFALSAPTGSSLEVANLEDVVDETTDLVYEEEIARNKYNLGAWWRYIKAVTSRKAPPAVRNRIYERALRCLPGSYKMWYAYLMDCKRQVKGKSRNSSRYTVVNNTFERALVFMHKYPRIWLEYCAFLMRQRALTKTRRTFDRALQALPIMQHARVWKLYMQFVKSPGIPQQTATRIYRRFLQFDPSQREDYVDFLLAPGVRDYGEAAAQLSMIVSDDLFVSKKGKTTHRLWMDLCDLITKHPAEASARVDIEAIIRSGIRRFTDEVGRLWCALADHYIRLANFEKARDVYEEGIETVHTVRDFSMIFDAYTRFEEAMVSAKMELAADEDEEEEESDAEDSGDDFDEDAGDVDLRIERLEHLMDRRPILLSSVLLRQNPHNVYEWQNRIKIFKELATRDPTALREVIVAYTEAVKTVIPHKATGKPHLLWVDFARFYEDSGGGDLNDAATIFAKAVEQPFKFVDDLAQVHAAWAEMYIRHKKYKAALTVVQRACSAPSAAMIREQRASGLPQTVQQKVHKSKRLWSLYVDLEENVGTLETTRAAYNRCIELKVITIKMLLNYATLLKSKKYFEDSFTVYEKGIHLFSWPSVKDIWLAYLRDFVERYSGTKLERARDLFEQCVDDCPPEHAKTFYFLYAKLEEEHGLVRHAMGILDRATQAVQEKDQYLMFVHYAKKAEQFFGVARTRAIYQKAIEVLPNAQVKDMCLRFAEMERKLGEIDRARAIFVYASQMCDPRVVVKFWQTWRDFEVAHGNQETYKDMQRVKRTVSAQFSQANHMTAEMNTAAPQVLSDAEATRLEAAKEARYAARGGGSGAAGVAAAAAAAGRREITELAKSAASVIRSEEGAAPKKRGIGDISNTASVEDSADSEGASALGAMERFKRSKAGQ